MQRKIYSVTIMIVFAMLCTSCRFVPKPISSEPTASSRTSEQEPLKMLTNSNIPFTGTATETGFYYIQPVPNDILTGNIRYIDYENAVDIFLSPQINGEHVSENDPSYLDSVIGETALFSCSNQLFFLRGGAPSYAANDSFGERALSAVYAMELDGSNRKRIYQGDSTSTLLPVALADDQFLYCFRMTMKEIELFKLTFDGGEETLVATFPFGTQFMGGWNRSLIVQTMKDIQAGNDHRTDYTVYAFNVDTGEQTPIVSWGSEKLVYTAVNQEAFYLMGVNDSQLERYTLAGAKETYQLGGYVSDTSFVCNPLTSMGRYLFVPYYDEHSDRYYNLVVDTNDFSAVKNTIAYYDEGKNTQYEAKVIAETEKEFLVITKNDMESAKLALGDGTETSIELPVYQMELFVKQDYLGSKNVSRQIVRQK